MPGSIVCNNCGGKDFYNEAGFYFCNECQTQTQEIREQVFDQQDNTAYLRTTKTTVRQEKSFSHDKLTSWEMFNYILHGLVEELNILGVNKNFKQVCYHLWIQYLTNLEIMCKVSDGLPKLNACFRRRDAEIVYNRSFTRKRKRSKSASATSSVISSGEPSSNDLEMKMIRKERSKQRRKLVRAEYDEYSNTNASSETSIHNQTLSSLGSDDESNSSSGSQIVFSKTAKKELLKIMSKSHLNCHINDTENKMDCHKFNQKLLNHSYRDTNILTRNKLYSIIYIGLLLTQDTFQISDIIRFCREGHLSFMDYKHFFPDIVSDDCIDESVYTKGTTNFIESSLMRKQAWDIYNIIELKKIDISPDLIKLCRRYCTELNLPDEVFNIAADFINETKPEFKTNETTKYFPNYEGRAMAFLMFALKILFSFDGATEYEFSNFANLLNKKQKNTKMFVFDDWFNYIQYRKLVLKTIHFPTKFQFDAKNRDSVDLYLNFMKQKKLTYDLETAATLPMKIARKYLIDLEIFQNNTTDDLMNFQPSVTPFRSYIDSIKNIEHLTINNILINRDILKDRSKDSIKYIIHHAQYLKSIKSSKCKIKQSGKNTNHVFYKIRKNGWDIFDVHKRNWHMRFEKEKMDILHFDHLLERILRKQVENINKPIQERLNKSAPIIKYVDKNQLAIKNNIGRDGKGRFCKKKSAENIGVDNFNRKHSKWFVSSWCPNPQLYKHEYNPSLVFEVVKDVEEKLSRSDNMIIAPKDKKNIPYPTHYAPWLEHWINIQEFNPRTCSEKWNEFNSSLPKNFRWLLQECATVIEQKPIDLFAEFVNVEVYMCYVHVKNTPILNKYCDNYKSITKIIQKVKNNW